MARNRLIQVYIDPDTHKRLAEIAESQERPMGKQIKILVYREWMRLFGKFDGRFDGQEVVDVEDLPGPEDAKVKPVVYVQPVQE